MVEVCVNKGQQSNRVASEHMFGLMKIDGLKKFAKQKRNQANINHFSRWRRVQEKCNKPFPFRVRGRRCYGKVQCIYSFMLQSLQNVIENEHESFSKMFTFLDICTYPWFNRTVNSFVSFVLILYETHWTCHFIYRRKCIHFYSKSYWTGNQRLLHG